MNDRLRKAYEFVKERHKEQKRKFTDKPYLGHLENTANLLWSEYEDAETDIFIAALLHDVVEDTSTTLKEVDQTFGRVVMDMVAELTTDDNEKNIKGKAVYLTEKINSMSENAFTIKLCDRLDNILDLNDTRVSLDFVTWYTKETKYIINNIDREITSIQKGLIKRIHGALLYLALNRGKDV